MYIAHYNDTLTNYTMVMHENGTVIANLVIDVSKV